MVGCDIEVSEAENTNALKIKKDATEYGYSMRTFIITDTETDCEYIVVQGAESIAITPRIKPEVIIKEKED